MVCSSAIVPHLRPHETYPPLFLTKQERLPKVLTLLKKVIPLTDKYAADEIIQYAAAVQQYSEHHIAKGILKTLKKETLNYGSQRISAIWQV